MDRRRPTPQEIAAAHGTKLKDVLAPGLLTVFCGINPGLYSGATGHHFARPGNRFWPSLHRSGWTDRLLHPSEDVRLPEYGAGVTNLVERATAAASELHDDEFVVGAKSLERKVRKFRPGCVAFLGIGAYAAAFGDKAVKIGPQPRTIAGACVWVLPNPSGLNAHYSLADFARLFAELRGELTAGRRG